MRGQVSMRQLVVAMLVTALVAIAGAVPVVAQVVRPRVVLTHMRFPACRKRQLSASRNWCSDRDGRSSVEVGQDAPRATFDATTRNPWHATIPLSTPGGTRTPNLLIRSQTLYPIELRARDVHKIQRGAHLGKRSLYRPTATPQRRSWAHGGFPHLRRRLPVA